MLSLLMLIGNGFLSVGIGHFLRLTFLLSGSFISTSVSGFSIIISSDIFNKGSDDDDDDDVNCIGCGVIDIAEGCVVALLAHLKDTG